MSIKDRLPKINKVAKAKTTLFNNPEYSKGVKKTYIVNSVRNDAPYQVFVEWSKQETLEVKTQLYTFAHKEQVTARGNHRVDFCKTTVCYQALGALKWAAQQAGKILSLCECKANAVKLLTFGGELVKITNLGGGFVWATIR